MATRQKRRAKKNHGEEQGEDRLSNLPDGILLHILSLLRDTRQCVQTSVLSKRWKLLWVSIPDLIFDRLESGTCFAFKKLVRHVLSKRDNLPLTEFSFKFHGKDKSITIISIVIKYAMSHNVQHFSLYLETTSLTLLFPLFNNCRFLKTLKLQYFNHLHLLENFTLPTLTTLYLHSCDFRGNAEFTSIDPFVGLVNLKTLQLHYSEIRNIGNFKITGPQLDCLTIRGHGHCKIEISAPNLRSLSLIYVTGMEFSNLDFPLLEIADIYCHHLVHDLSNHKMKKSLSDLISVFRRLYHAQSLLLSFNVIKGLMDFPEVLENEPSPFVNLKTLKVSCDSSSSFTMPDNVMNYFGENVTLEIR